MAQAQTKVEAVQVQPGVVALVDPTKDIVGAVAVGEKIYVVTATKIHSPKKET